MHCPVLLLLFKLSAINLQSVSSVKDIIRIISAGGVSLNSILKDDTKVKNLIALTLKLDPQMLEILMNASIKPELVIPYTLLL